MSSEIKFICMQTICGHTPTHDEPWILNASSKYEVSNDN
jgi:hypothetical protein